MEKIKKVNIDSSDGAIQDGFESLVRDMLILSKRIQGRMRPAANLLAGMSGHSKLVQCDVELNRAFDGVSGAFGLFKSALMINAVKADMIEVIELCE